MAVSAYADICRFNATTGGTTDWTYSSAVTGYQSPTSAGVVTATQYSYRAESIVSGAITDWENGFGICTITAGVPTFARTTIIASSTGSKVNFAVAPQVALVALKEDLRAAPTRQVLTSGTTYTTPPNCLYIRVRMIGAGGGGAGSGTGTPGSGGNGGNTTFNTTTTAPGGSGCPAGGQQFGAGGVAGATVDFSIPGGPGGFGVSAVAMAGSGAGGNGAFGGAGPGAPVGNGVAAQAGATNSGSGGGGAGASAASLFGSGGGGGAGAYSEKTIASPASSYSYAIGGAGSAGTAGTGGAAGAAGAAGIIVVDEFYN